jgi:hypothetical protein
MMNLAAFWQQMLPTMPVLPVLQANKYLFVNNLSFDPYYGMEKVIGSVPIRTWSVFLKINVQTSLPTKEAHQTFFATPRQPTSNPPEELPKPIFNCLGLFKTTAHTV